MYEQATNILDLVCKNVPGSGRYTIVLTGKDTILQLTVQDGEIVSKLPEAISSVRAQDCTMTTWVHKKDGTMVELDTCDLSGDNGVVTV